LSGASHSIRLVWLVRLGRRVSLVRLGWLILLARLSRLASLARLGRLVPLATARSEQEDEVLASDDSFPSASLPRCVRTLDSGHAGQETRHDDHGITHPIPPIACSLDS
jgi:hypothetical protein